MQHDAVAVDPERACEAGRVGLPDPVRVHDPLRVAGGPGAVDDVERVVVVQAGIRRLLVRRGGRQLAERPVPLGLARDQPAVDRELARARSSSGASRGAVTTAATPESASSWRSPSARSSGLSGTTTMPVFIAAP